MGDEEKEVGTTTMITRTIEAATPLLVKLAPYVIPLLLGGSAGVAGSRVADAQNVATAEEAREKALKNEAELKAQEATMAKERAERRAEREAQQKLRDEQVRKLEARVFELEIQQRVRERTNQGGN